MRSAFRTLSLALCAGLLISASCNPARIIPGPFIRDAEGRALILHGINFSSSSKFPPYLPWQNQADMQRMSRDWGFNFTRYLVSWIAIEPQPGVYDEAYLDQVEAWLDDLHAEGLYVVIDMHQDVYGPVDSDGRTLAGNGHPAWSFLTDGEPFFRYDEWFLNYFTEAVTRGFDNLWDYQGHPELQDHYAGVLKRLAQRFGDHPAVLGYDIMNEPWAGTDALSNQDRFDTGPYKDFLDRMIAAIRSEDSENWIFFEPRAYGPNDGSPSFIPKLSDPRSGEPRIAYFPHYYSVAVDVGLAYRQGIDTSMERWEVERRKEVAIYDMPLLIGEWGTGTHVTDWEPYLKDVLAMADRVTSGWAHWDYSLGGGWSPVNADRTESPVADLLVRAYPRRVSGTPLHVEYDPDARTLLFSFENEPGVTAPTEVYVPEGRFFPEGFGVFVSDDAGSWQGAWDSSAEVLTLCVDPGRSLHFVGIHPLPKGAVNHSGLPEGRLASCGGPAS